VLFSEKLGLDLPRKASKKPRKERRYTGLLSLIKIIIEG